MGKRKIEAVAPAAATNGVKKQKHTEIEKAPAKKVALLDGDSSGSEDESDNGGVPLEGSDFKINEEYARRFEHNKKREELHRLEEKFKNDSRNNRGRDEDDDNSDDDSTSEEEDDDGFLATEDLDAEISATLQAIRSKDPRVYDSTTSFYKSVEETGAETTEKAKTEKPVYLKDYHRQNLLNGGIVEDEEPAVKTFAQEQEELRRDVVGSMHAMAEGAGSDDEDDGFIVRKPKPDESKPETDGDIHPSRAAKIGKTKVTLDVTIADKDPETFLSNFISSRAWLPGDGARFQPLESDDDEEDARAEAYEQAYNMRFEDPNTSNEVLRSYARDVIASRSVRREEKSSRKKAREAAQEKKAAEKREREEDKARLRKLKIEQMEEKLDKIKQAAGLRGKSLEGDWTKFLEVDWDDDTWEAEMNKRFGEDYYAEEDAGSTSEDDLESKSKKKKPKKPKWDDDIDIKDIVPDFDEDEQPNFTLSDDDGAANSSDEEGIEDGTNKKRKTSKAIKEEKLAARKAARKERKKIEELVDAQLDIEAPLAPIGSTKAENRSALFRYRETSPTAFGLTPRDILLADDKALNEFAGLKKLAAFRDPEKKKKDKKHLSKKARLRQWRKETFGDEEGPKGGFRAEGTDADHDVEMADASARVDAEVEKGAVNGVKFGERKKKKRSKKRKTGESEV